MLFNLKYIQNYFLITLFLIKGLFFRQKIGAINYYPSDLYLFKANKSNTDKTTEICSKLTIKTLEQGY